MKQPEFWENAEKAAGIKKKFWEISDEVEELEEIQKNLEELKKLSQIEDKDDSFRDELETICDKIEEKIKGEEKKIFLSGQYDKGSAILSIYSGAGGQDAQDWATMLLRMYRKYCERKNFKMKVLDHSFGEGGGPDGRIGTKSVTLEIKGKFAYGFLSKETGVHRLVRLSPFSTKQLRHTSFVLVEVLPDISKEIKKVEIKHDDLKLETFRSSGPGGQYVNKRESAVRVIHLPTGIRVSCQSERLQGLNKEKAMKVLAAKLYQLKKTNQKKEISEIKGDKTSAGWGNQIRSYVFHPYQMVKDLRTDIETSDIEGVLDGELDEFISAEIKIK